MSRETGASLHAPAGRGRGGVAFRLSADRVLALITAAIGIAAFAGTYGFARVPPSLMGGLGAVEFPRLVAASLLILAVMLAFREVPSEALAPFGRSGWVIIGACIAFIGLVHVAGMLVSMLAFLVGAGRLWGERRILLLLGVSLCVTLAIWLLFQHVLGVTLPRGLAGEALFH